LASKPLDELREIVWRANIDIVKAGLVVLTWGNVSGIDRERGVVAIKPSGVCYETLQPNDIVLVSLETGRLWPESGCAPRRTSPPTSAFTGNSRMSAAWRTRIPGTPQAGLRPAGKFPVTEPRTRTLSTARCRSPGR